MGAGGGRALEEPAVGLLAPDYVASRAMQGGGDALAQVGGTRIYGEARKLAVVRLVEPVGEPHQRDLRSGVRHQPVPAGLVPRELLAVDEQRVQPRLRGVVGRRGAAWPRSHDHEIIPVGHRPPSPGPPDCVPELYFRYDEEGTWSTATGQRATRWGSAPP